MSIPITSIVLNANNSWTFSWTSTGALQYRVILYGRLIATVTTTSYVWLDNFYTEFPPPLEISDQTSVESELFQPYFIIQWYGIPACRKYIIQYLNGSTWQQIVMLTETGQWLYTYQTGTLIDGNTYQLRVIAVDSLGNQSIPQQFKKLIVTPPVTPDGVVVISYMNPNLVISQG